MLAIYLTLIDDENDKIIFRNFSGVIKKIHKFLPAETIAYAVIINRNLCYDILKKENKQISNVITDEYIESKAGPSFNESFENMLVSDAVEKMPEIFHGVML